MLPTTKGCKSFAGGFVINSKMPGFVVVGGFLFAIFGVIAYQELKAPKARTEKPLTMPPPYPLPNLGPQTPSQL